MQHQSQQSRKKRRNVYFTKDTENAIVLYNKLDDEIERNRVYNEFIKVPLDKLAENIMNTFKFSYFDDSFNNIKADVVSFLIEKMNQFDASKGKAFSYFSIVAKNYLILTNNTNYKKFKSHDEIDVVDMNRNFHGEYKQKEKTADDAEFIKMLIAYWENNITTIFRREQDIKIADAIIHLFRKIGDVEEFNKKALYILVREYVRDIPNCKTQQITRVVNEMKKYYAKLAAEYHSRGELETEKMNEFF